MSDDNLLEALLSKPVGYSGTARPKKSEFTRSIEVTGDRLELTIPESDVEDGEVPEHTAKRFIETENMDPDEWEVSSWRRGEWGDPENPFISIFFQFRRRKHDAVTSLEIDEILDEIEAYKPSVVLADFPETPVYDGHAFALLIGDMQFGKIDGDGIRGTVQRTIEYINKAADRYLMMRQLYDISQVHIAWLGDHIEGFVSQGGANVWRTQLPLTEQIRLTRRVMLHALTTFAPLTSKLTMVAVPGNHGETVRFESKGVTRYDDSHDTESLIAVADGVDLAREYGVEALNHVEFYVPDTDELTVTLDVAGTNIAHAHGHYWRPGKHFEWWKGQAFDSESMMGQADVLVAGHEHHETTDTDGQRMFIRTGALESESTWYRHRTGSGGNPGLTYFITKDRAVDLIGYVR